MRALPPLGLMTQSKAFDLLATTPVSLLASALAPRSAEQSAIGMARNATLTKQKRSPPVPPEPDAAAALRGEARSELDIAHKLIAECRYHRRDEELAELDAVVAGARRFADLPLRV
jgi:hypothetical protein